MNIHKDFLVSVKNSPVAIDFTSSLAEEYEGRTNYSHTSHTQVQNPATKNMMFPLCTIQQISNLQLYFFWTNDKKNPAKHILYRLNILNMNINLFLDTVSHFAFDIVLFYRQTFSFQAFVPRKK